MRAPTGRPGGHRNRSGPATRSGDAPDPALLRVIACRRTHRAAAQALDNMVFVISRCIEAEPSIDLLLRRDAAEKAVALAADRLARAIRAAQNKLISSVPEVV